MARSKVRNAASAQLFVLKGPSRVWPGGRPISVVRSSLARTWTSIEMMIRNFTHLSTHRTTSCRDNKLWTIPQLQILHDAGCKSFEFHLRILLALFPKEILAYRGIVGLHGNNSMHLQVPLDWTAPVSALRHCIVVWLEWCETGKAWRTASTGILFQRW